MFSVFCLATLEIISVGAGLVKMLGVEAELFVTIDDSGVVRATVSNLCIAPTYFRDRACIPEKNFYFCIRLRRNVFSLNKLCV